MVIDKVMNLLKYLFSSPSMEISALFLLPFEWKQNVFIDHTIHDSYSCYLHEGVSEP